MEETHENKEENYHPIICKHWKRNKQCLYGTSCRFLHPEDYIINPETNFNIVRSNHRSQVKNRSKAGILRRWLINKFGRDYLKQGSGILDMYCFDLIYKLHN